MTASKLLSMSEAAECLGISVDTLRRIHKRGDIIFSLIGGNWKISQHDLIEYYERHKKKIVNHDANSVKKKTKPFQKEVKPIGYNSKGEPYWV